LILPIPGTSSLTHLEENMKAGEISLTGGDLAEIEQAVRT